MKLSNRCVRTAAAAALIAASGLNLTAAGAQPLLDEETDPCHGDQTRCHFQSDGCPDPKTCPNYRNNYEPGHGWSAAADGLVHIDYWINPTRQTAISELRRPGSSLSDEQVIQAIQQAFSTWQAWHPHIRFDYQGETETPAGHIPDGQNVVGFGQPLIPGAIAETSTRGDAQHIREADIVIVNGGWSWRPCEQRDDSCPDERINPYEDDPRCDQFEQEIQMGDVRIWTECPLRSLEIDLQGITTHEVGHVLGMTHAPGPESRYLTMVGGDRGGESFGNHRHFSTLGLGDVLGVRALYPFECPDPGPDGSVPPEYRNVCPAITVYAP